MSPCPSGGIVSSFSCELFVFQFGLNAHRGASTGSPFSAIRPVGCHTTGSPGPSGTPFASTNVPSHRKPFGLDVNERTPLPAGNPVISSHWPGSPALYLIHPPDLDTLEIAAGVRIVERTCLAVRRPCRALEAERLFRIDDLGALPGERAVVLEMVMTVARAELEEVVRIELAVVTGDEIVHAADGQRPAADVLVGCCKLKETPPAGSGHALLDHVAPVSVDVAVRDSARQKVRQIELQVGFASRHLTVANAVGQGRVPCEPLVPHRGFDLPDLVLDVP